jgi:hypothetical protein
MFLEKKETFYCILYIKAIELEKGSFSQIYRDTNFRIRKTGNYSIRGRKLNNSNSYLEKLSL